MSTPRFFLLSLFLITLGACATGPALVPSDRVGIAPMPYTPEAIRDFNRAGTSLTFEVREGEAASLLTFHWTGGDEQTAEFDTIVADLEGQELNKSSARVTWSELQSHAAFPVEATTISEATVEGPSGRWDCWCYTVEREGQLERYWFAKRKPGPPVRMVVEARGERLSSMELVEMQR